MNLLLIGVNHQTAPVELREKLVALFGEPLDTYRLLLEVPQIQEVFFYTTCNRVEVICATEEPEPAAAHLIDWLSSSPGVNPDSLRKALYVLEDREAVQHLFRVAASLDAMVVGEPQILGQVKEAYRQGAKSGGTGPVLNRLVHKSFSVAKRVRSETGIGDHAVSVSYAAVMLGRKIFGDLAGKAALLVGAGEMAELAVEHLKGQGVSRLIVANRTLERAVQLARRFDGEAVSLEELESQLLIPDILISSTGAGAYVLTQEQVKAAMRRRKQRPLFMIDIAVPRDLDPRLNDLDNVYLYNIDDLREVVEHNRERRRAEAGRAEGLVAEESHKFMDWMKTLSVFPTIISLKEKAARICEAELKKTVSQLGPITPEQEESLKILTQAITQKLLHDPIIFLKRNQRRKRPHQELDLVRRLFNLDPDRQDEPGHQA